MPTTCPRKILGLKTDIDRGGLLPRRTIHINSPTTFTLQREERPTVCGESCHIDPLLINCVLKSFGKTALDDIDDQLEIPCMQEEADSAQILDERSMKSKPDRVGEPHKQPLQKPSSNPSRNPYCEAPKCDELGRGTYFKDPVTYIAHHPDYSSQNSK